MSKDEKKTASQCWLDVPMGEDTNDTIRGLCDIVWTYSRSWATNFNPDLTPGELSDLLRTLGKEAIALVKAINALQGSRVFLSQIGKESSEDPPRPRAIGFRKWFVTEQQDGALVEDLRYLQKISRELAIEVVKQKATKSGRRSGPAGRKVMLETLLMDVGRIVLIHRRPRGHIVPIARSIHECATGKGVGRSSGSSWGLRSYKRIQALLDDFEANLPPLPTPGNATVREHTRLIQFLIEHGVISR